mgnify:CR=1 FL=1
MQNDLFEKAPVHKAYFSFALPVVFSMVISLIYNMADTYFIAGTGNTNLVAGVSLGAPIFTLMIALGDIFGLGGSSVISRLFGQKKDEDGKRLSVFCFYGAIVCGVIVAAVMMIFRAPILQVLGADSDTIVYASQYYTWLVLGAPFIILVYTPSNLLRTEGFAVGSMTGTVLGAVVNIILDPIFIYGLHMGVRGAALATIISQGLSCIWILRFLTGKKTRLRLKKSDMHLEKRIVIPCLGLGLGPFVMQATDALLNIAFNSSLQHYGGDIAVGCMTISSTIQQMVWIPVQGIGQGAQPIISYNYGAGNAKRIRQTFKCMLAVSMTALTVFWLFVQLSPTTFIRIFSNSEEIIATAGWTLRVYMAVFCMFSIQMSVQQTFTALGKAKASLFIACLRKIILLIPLIFILPHFFDNKVFAVFLAEPVSDTISITASIITFRIVFKKAMQSISKSA